MRMGIVSRRRKKQRAERLRRRMMIAACVLLLACAAMSPQLREKISTLSGNVGAFGSSHDELTLGELEVYALQLAVFDSGERAADEARRLTELGICCVIWQREKMRIVADVAFSRGALRNTAAQGQEAYVIREVLPKVSLRLTADTVDLPAALALLELPDRVLEQILDGNAPLDQIAAQIEPLAAQALKAHPENTLYTQLAQSLLNWCALMEKSRTELTDELARSYAAVTMCTLCRELRMALESQTVSDASTASAQRTPSTAADVMPPA